MLIDVFELVWNVFSESKDENVKTLEHYFKGCNKLAWPRAKDRPNS